MPPQARIRKTALTGLALLALLGSASAQDKPALPKTPAGFDEGRVAVLRDCAEQRFEPRVLLERLFEEADLAELAAFCHARLLRSERTQLDTLLGLNGALGKAADAAAIETVFLDAKLKPAAVAAALGRVAAQPGFKTAEVAAWLYGRGCNFRQVQRALDGARADSMRARRQLRELAASGKDAGALFEKGHWEFNLEDAGDHPGGHYSGVQLMESLLALGWKEEHFQRAVGKLFPSGMSAAQRALIGWGDAHLCWAALSQHVAESELARAAIAQLKSGKEAVLPSAMQRTRACDRWFRTGGEGVVGVWTGPMPGVKGEPKPPRLPDELSGPEVTPEHFMKALTDEFRAHFSQYKADTLTVAGYADGSARMILDRPSRAALPYGPDTPPGADGTKQLYEGRFSVKGRIAYAEAVFAEGKSIAPQQVDMVNLRLLAGGALLAADLDDGTTLTPVLLRRASRLIDAP